MAARPVDNPLQGFLTFVGESTLILADSVKRLGRRPFEAAETFSQMAFIGVASVPIVCLTGFATGAVFSLYLSQFLSQYGAQQFVGATVGLSVTRELAPVLAGVTVAARCGSAMAAQLGTMSVTEQVDALKMLSVNPTSYLVIPRLIASITMLPILALICMWSGVVGGLIVAQSAGISPDTFLQSLAQFVKPSDFLGGLAKAPVFGLLIAVVACQQGLRTTQGAVGVGRSTTNAVVISMLLVYIADFVMAQLMYG